MDMMEKQRHEAILDILSDQNFARVTELSARLEASQATIRRDIVTLSKQNMLAKIRGGVQSLQNNSKLSRLKGATFSNNKEQFSTNKKRIADKAVELCEEGESIIINGGSTTFMMRYTLKDRQLNIMTNSFPLAYELNQNSNNRISLTGGELYKKQSIVLSAYENDASSYYRGSKMFMGALGVSEEGVMESDPLLIQAEQRLKKQAETLILLADSSKLGIKSGMTFCPLSEIDILITDKDADENYLKVLEKHGVKIIIAD